MIRCDVRTVRVFIEYIEYKVRGLNKPVASINDDYTGNGQNYTISIIGGSQMLWNVSKQQPIDSNYIPHPENYQKWVESGLMTPLEIDAIKAEIKRLIKAQVPSGNIATAGWLPGSNWNGTPFEVIYTKACRKDQNSAAKCFGLMVWVTLMEDSDYWAFGHFSLNDIPIESMTYFKVHPQKP